MPEVRIKDIVMVSPWDLKPHPKNPNKHSQEQIERLAKIIEYQGWRYPIKVDKATGYVTSGHGRLEAAKIMDWRLVPVSYQDYDNDDQAYQDVISDNAIANWAELDLASINMEVINFDPNFDIDLLGIKDFVLEPAEKFEPKSDEDEVPDKVDPKAKPGDIYQLGRHRLMCGDSTNIEAIEKLMDGEKADMVLADPPYNFETKGGGIFYENQKMKEIKKLKIDKFDPLNLNYDLAPTHVYYCNRILIKKYIELSENWSVSFDLAISHKIFSPANWGNHLQTDVEYIMILGKQSPNKGLEAKYYSKLCSGKKNIEDENSAGWAKPVWQCEKWIKLYSTKTVIDIYGGSGSTLIACEKTNRKCFMMEIDPHYIDVIIARWEKYTGQKAELLNG